MSLRAGGYHHRDEDQAERAQRLTLRVAALAGARSRLYHPGRGGLCSPGCVRARLRRAMTKARHGQPCLHGHSVDRRRAGLQVRH